jgi:transposase-like protein
MAREIDLPAVESDLAAGASVKETARKHGLPESTLRGRLRKAHANGAAAVRTPRTVKQETNGAAHDDDLEALAQFLDGQWKRLTLLQRVRCLLTIN